MARFIVDGENIEIEIYIEDLIPEIKDDILKELGDNGNYDLIPIGVIKIK